MKGEKKKQTTTVIVVGILGIKGSHFIVMCVFKTGQSLACLNDNLRSKKNERSKTII